MLLGDPRFSCQCALTGLTPALPLFAEERPFWCGELTLRSEEVPDALLTSDNGLSRKIAKMEEGGIGKELKRRAVAREAALASQSVVLEEERRALEEDRRALEEKEERLFQESVESEKRTLERVCGPPSPAGSWSSGCSGGNDRAYELPRGFDEGDDGLSSPGSDSSREDGRHTKAQRTGRAGVRRELEHLREGRGGLFPVDQLPTDMGGVLQQKTR